jgi:hypothetical protein
LPLCAEFCGKQPVPAVDWSPTPLLTLLVFILVVPEYRAYRRRLLLWGYPFPPK